MDNWIYKMDRRTVIYLVAALFFQLNPLQNWITYYLILVFFFYFKIMCFYIVVKITKLIYILNNYTQNYPFCRLQILVESFELV